MKPDAGGLLPEFRHKQRRVPLGILHRQVCPVLQPDAAAYAAPNAGHADLPAARHPPRLFPFLQKQDKAAQKVHIYLEDHAHFAAFSGDLVPDNGAAEQVVEFCVVDDFYFFPYLAETQPPHEFYAEVLAVLQPEATRCKCAVEVRRFSLRAPPAA